MYATYTNGNVHTTDEEVLWRKDGSAFPVSYTSTPIEKDGSLVGAVVTFSDITLRKMMGDELLIAKEAAEEAT